MRSRFAGTALAALAVAGCAGILGIPSDVELTDEAGGDAAASDAPNDAFVPVDAGRDADAAVPVDGAADADADAPPPLCDPTKEFGAPVLLTTLSTAEDEGSVRLTDDELTVYFDAVRSPAPYFDLYTAKRSALTDSFGTPTLMAGDINTANNHEFAPNVSADGLKIFFERQEPGLTNDDFWTASRPDLLSPFTGASQLAGVNTPTYEGKLFVRGDGSELYFTKQVGTVYNLHVAKRVAGNYVVTQLANVNSASGEYAPVIAKDGLSLYFASQRAAVGASGENIWVATRASTNDDFGTAFYLTNVNALGSNEEPVWLSNDRCRLYLTSDRAGGAGNKDIYLATRPK